ncbi:MAG: hypothetical protein VR70_06925 [Rhodospirillaceae bacterium BRH_c57]|nr:MAG: hypothetical protein VR70_06925 [Rhodospirillaceae bacterium BRH_c57]
MKCVLRYSGGKYLLAPTLVSARALMVQEYREPFVGGGSVFFAMRERGVASSYWINDADPKIAQFWTVVRDQADNLCDLLFTLLAEHGNTKELFLVAKTMMESENAVEAAAGLWIVNRLAYAGMVAKGGFNPTYLDESRGVKANFIQNIRRASHLLQGVRITNLDYKEVVAEPGEDVMVFADPPYHKKGKTIYEFGEINLDEFRETVAQSPHNILVTIDDSPENIERLSGFTILRRAYNANIARHGKISELIAMNYPPPNPMILGQIGEVIARPADNDNSPQGKNLKIAALSPYQPVAKVRMDRGKHGLFVNLEPGQRNTEWYTPDWILNPLYEAMGNQPFDLDPCSPIKGPDAPVWAKKHFTRKDDGLSQDWHGRVWLNPPYASLADWIRKAADATWCRNMRNPPTEESAQREHPLCESVVALIPARTHTVYWQDYITNHARVLFLHGKIGFRMPTPEGLVQAKTQFPEGLAFVIWGNHRPFTQALLTAQLRCRGVSDRSGELSDAPWESYWQHRPHLSVNGQQGEAA